MYYRYYMFINSEETNKDELENESWKEKNLIKPGDEISQKSLKHLFTHNFYPEKDKNNNPTK